MFIEDLSTRAYFAHGQYARAVGWLETDHPYQQGTVPVRFLARLKQHVDTAYQPVLFMGFHECSLCQEGDRKAGLRNLLIPTERLLYVAPEMIVHYIEDHGYQPPQEFVEAVMACPEQASVEYSALIRQFEKSWM